MTSVNLDHGIGAISASSVTVINQEENSNPQNICEQHVEIDASSTPIRGIDLTTTQSLEAPVKVSSWRVVRAISWLFGWDKKNPQSTNKNPSMQQTQLADRTIDVRPCMQDNIPSLQQLTQAPQENVQPMGLNSHRVNAQKNKGQSIIQSPHAPESSSCILPMTNGSHSPRRGILQWVLNSSKNVLLDGFIASVGVQKKYRDNLPISTIRLCKAIAQITFESVDQLPFIQWIKGVAPDQWQSVKLDVRIRDVFENALLIFANNLRKHVKNISEQQDQHYLILNAASKLGSISLQHIYNSNISNSEGVEESTQALSHPALDSERSRQEYFNKLGRQFLKLGFPKGASDLDFISRVTRGAIYQQLLENFPAALDLLEKEILSQHALNIVFDKAIDKIEESLQYEDDEEFEVIELDKNQQIYGRLIFALIGKVIPWLGKMLGRVPGVQSRIETAVNLTTVAWLKHRLIMNLMHDIEIVTLASLCQGNFISVEGQMQFVPLRLDETPESRFCLQKFLTNEERRHFHLAVEEKTVRLIRHTALFSFKKTFSKLTRPLKRAFHWTHIGKVTWNWGAMFFNKLGSILAKPFLLLGMDVVCGRLFDWLIARPATKKIMAIIHEKDHRAILWKAVDVCLESIGLPVD